MFIYYIILYYLILYYIIVYYIILYIYICPWIISIIFPVKKLRYASYPMFLVSAGAIWCIRQRRSRGYDSMSSDDEVNEAKS